MSPLGIQARFWTHFSKYLNAHPAPGLSSRTPSMAHFMKLAGGGGWEIAVRFNIKAPQMEADLTLSGESAKEVFDRLKQRFGPTGNTEMGRMVHWEREASPRPTYPRPRNPESSVYVRQAIEPDNQAKWDEYCDWLIRHATTLLRWHES